jgi:uncharacterized protein (TIGR02145 family)
MTFPELKNLHTMKKRPYIRTELIMMALILLFLATGCKKEKESSDITDVDGNVYTTVTIGTQVWLQQALAVTRYNNGDPIGTTNPATLNIFGEDQPKYQWANEGVESRAATYGRLYTWYVVNDSRGICPAGWHVPTDIEWKTLEKALGMSQAEADLTGSRGTNEGSQLAGNETLWEDGNLDSDPGFGTSGFAALPGGNKSTDGTFEPVGRYCYFWSSTEQSSTDAWRRSIYNYETGINRHYRKKVDGFSVRCIKD